MSLTIKFQSVFRGRWNQRTFRYPYRLPSHSHYPDIAEKVCGKITAGEADRGIVLCGTGIGISIAANKIKGIRAALCGDVFSARMSREHNDANVLALGGRVTGIGPAGEIVRTWVTTEFSNGERHIRRIEKMMALENK